MLLAVTWEYMWGHTLCPMYFASHNAWETQGSIPLVVIAAAVLFTFCRGEWARHNEGEDEGDIDEGKAHCADTMLNAKKQTCRDKIWLVVCLIPEEGSPCL